MGRPAVDLTNQKFNFLTALYRDTAQPSGAGQAAYWVCQCDCGNIVDLNNIKCLIEYQGEQHFVPFHFDNEQRFNLRREYDQNKRNYCASHNLPLMEIPYIDFAQLSWDYLVEKYGGNI